MSAFLDKLENCIQKSVIFTNSTILSKQIFLKKKFQNRDNKCHFSKDL